ncbi:MAG: hypothetical protein ACTSYL_12705 [Candidatus Thorarchaeota archaeon]
MAHESDTPTNVRYGDLLIERDEDTGRARAWLIFQRYEDSSEYYVGLVRLGPWRDLAIRHYRTVITLDDLVHYAGKIHDGVVRRPFVLTDGPQGDVFWIPMDLDDFADRNPEALWNPFAKFSFGPPAEGATAPLRWIRFSIFFPEPAPIPFAWSQIPRRPENMDSLEDQLLAGIVQRFRNVRRVQPHLESDGVSYKIRFLSIKDHNEVSRYTTMLSEDVRAVLRDPLVRGIAYTTGDGVDLTWDPHSDIIYGNLVTDGLVLSLDLFQPYVLQSREFFNLPLPETATALAGMSIGDLVKILIHHDATRCPMMGDVHDACWRVVFDGAVGSRIKAIEQEPLLAYRVVSLVRAPFLIDTETSHLHPTSVEFKIDDKDLLPPWHFVRDKRLREALVRAGIKAALGSFKEFDEFEQYDDGPSYFGEGFDGDSDYETDSEEEFDASGPDYDWVPDEVLDFPDDAEDLDSVWDEKERPP